MGFKTGARKIVSKFKRHAPPQPEQQSTHQPTNQPVVIQAPQPEPKPDSSTSSSEGINASPAAPIVENPPSAPKAATKNPREMEHNMALLCQRLERRLKALGSAVPQECQEIAGEVFGKQKIFLNDMLKFKIGSPERDEYIRQNYRDAIKKIQEVISIIDPKHPQPANWDSDEDRLQKLLAWASEVTDSQPEAGKKEKDAEVLKHLLSQKYPQILSSKSALEQPDGNIVGGLFSSNQMLFEALADDYFKAPPQPTRPRTPSDPIKAIIEAGPSSPNPDPNPNYSPRMGM